MSRRKQSVSDAKPVSRRPDGSRPSGRNGLDRSRVQEIQRARIVAACVQAVAAHGRSGLSVARIVSRAGVSRRTFYELFCGCEDCFLAAFEHCVKRLSERVLPAYEAGTRWQDRIRAALVELLSTLDEDPALARVVFVESLAAGPRALERRSLALAPVVSAIDAGRTAAKNGSSTAPLVAEGIVGAVCSVIHARLLSRDPMPLVRLTNELMSLIVLPFLGSAATRAELSGPAPRARRGAAQPGADGDLLRAVGMRITYRTANTLMAIADQPLASNRRVAELAGIADQGQISKLLRRLQRLGLIENLSLGIERGAANSWRLTERGEAVVNAIGGDAC